MKKLKIALRFWLWAAMHSPHFAEFQILLDPAPVRLSIKFFPDLLAIELAINKPSLWIYYPWGVFLQFVQSRKDAGEIIDPRIFYNIPF